LLGSIWRGGKWASAASWQTLAGLWGMIRGQVSASELAGPIYILDAAGENAKRGFSDLLYFTAILSVSLAVLNLLPVPILDGGHLLIFTIEKLFGSISLRVKEAAQQVGVLFILGLMCFAIYNDISRDTPPPAAGDIDASGAAQFKDVELQPAESAIAP